MSLFSSPLSRLTASKTCLCCRYVSSATVKTSSPITVKSKTVRPKKKWTLTPPGYKVDTAKVFTDAPKYDVPSHLADPIDASIEPPLHEPIMGKYIHRGVEGDSDRRYTACVKLMKDRSRKDTMAISKAMEMVQRRVTTLISIDLEANEKKLSDITEVGISIYDPLYQQKSPVPHITSMHFLPKEHIEATNSMFVPNNKHRFYGGTSFIMPLKEIKIVIDEIIDFYNNREIVCPPGTPKIALVGHNFAADLRFLREFDVHFPKGTSIIDTMQIWEASVMDRKKNLSYVLSRCGIPNVFSHNGGNDAYVTLLLALKLCDVEFRLNYLYNHKEGLLNIHDRETVARSAVKKPRFPPQNEFNGSIDISADEVIQRLKKSGFK